MSRSYKKTPIGSRIVSRDSEKADKQQNNRNLRRAVRIALAQEEETPVLREVGNAASFAKDGKRRFDPTEEPKEMRK